ncbi:hypothetical protein C499_01755 [Halogeometricum borinquense DSM 11551]|uniref:Uncharacterized protein n=1 Tax=Halogeometricum borinquense (strain ATCC 700274 / DSM 11551 / JCM 10706 / KCTC 4070 / PR3) TaxID=469382 RepID=E4NP10_HALBP|nr:hypothetical protein [Halogeometricum borinquense]ADQ66441.1 hypothetical protein Hbor_08450 [Halogeometricum borinquense DSM 11551]ELY31161.1 hypothetical protein C499_01755 [Halogeometricum borinquense DSM 11551]
MNRSVVLSVTVVSALLGTVVGFAFGWVAMQPMGLIAGGIVGYSVSRTSDAIFDSLLSGFLGGILALVLVNALNYTTQITQAGDAAAAGQQAIFLTIYGLLFVPGAYAVGALLTAPTVVYLKPRVRRAFGQQTA